MTEGRQRRSGRMTDTTSYNPHMQSKQLDAHTMRIRARRLGKPHKSHGRLLVQYGGTAGREANERAGCKTIANEV